MNIVVVYFIYGLAFFSMGLALLFESGRSPSLADSRVLRPLAFFGLIHGAHEWLEMFMTLDGWVDVPETALIGWLRLLALGVSFILLLTFGLLMIQFLWKREHRKALWLAPAACFGLAMLSVLGPLTGPGVTNSLIRLDVIMRYLLAVPGAAMAGVGLLGRGRLFSTDGRPRVGLWLRAAAAGFLLYSLTQLVVPPAGGFPAAWLNTTSFQAATGVPVQVVRSAAAVGITFSLIAAVNILEADRQVEFLAAQQARLDALAQIEKGLLEREAMRQDLLRHIVMAQEDERARIARELHDETSQTLTAFTFHLAVLRQNASRNPKAREQLEYLQSLSRQMSQDIYRLVRDLRPAQLDDLGLVAALQYLVDEQEKHVGLAVELCISGDRRRMESLVETVLFRVAQEALTNVARHSGVLKAVLRLEFTPEQVILVVEDHGCGFDLPAVSAPSAGMGLAGMRERVASIGAQLDIQSVSGRGTRVQVTVHSVDLKKNLFAAASVDSPAGKQFPDTAAGSLERHQGN